MYFLKLNSRELHDSRREKAQFSLTQLYPKLSTEDSEQIEGMECDTVGQYYERLFRCHL